MSYNRKTNTQHYVTKLSATDFAIAFLLFMALAVIVLSVYNNETNKHKKTEAATSVKHNK